MAGWTFAYKLTARGSPKVHFYGMWYEHHVVRWNFRRLYCTDWSLEGAFRSTLTLEG